MGIQKWAVGALSALALATASHAAGFVNGGFEDGTTNGWTEGGATRNADLSDLVPSNYLNGAAGRSSVVSAGPDPVVGAALGSIVYSGNSAFRVEDTTDGGYLSVISQTVNNYTDANIFFAWKAVLESNHSAEQAAGMKIELVDLTANGGAGETVISRIYSAEINNVDNRFSLQGAYYYTPAWQIEQLTIDATRQGHDFRLTVLATDCDPTAHLGYVYLDGFGSVTPPPTDVPEPASALLAGTALLGLWGVRRRKQA